jgi:hypothetical protein
LATSSEVNSVRQLVIDVADTVLPAELDDGLIYDLSNVTAEVIREEDQYSGVRVRLVALLASAKEPFHVDVNVGDPIWPEPAQISLPRLLGQQSIELRGYPMEMVLAEKIATALERGVANTRWRDFGDIFVITGHYGFVAKAVREALQAVADYRNVELVSLDEVLEGYVEIAQPRWGASRRKLQLTEALPDYFGDALEAFETFANPIIKGSLSDAAAWDPGQRVWK